MKITYNTFEAMVFADICIRVVCTFNKKFYYEQSFICVNLLLWLHERKTLHILDNIFISFKSKQWNMFKKKTYFLRIYLLCMIQHQQILEAHAMMRTKQNKQNFLCF